MRICFIMRSHWSFALGGAEIQVKLLVDRLLTTSHDIFFICEQSTITTYKKCSIKILGTNKQWLNFGSAIASRKVYNLLRSIQPDIIYIRADVGYLFPATLYKLKAKKVRVILHIANIQNVDRYKISGLKQVIFSIADQLFYKASIKKVDKIICQAKYQGRMLEKNFGISNYITIPNYHQVPETINQPGHKKPMVITWVSNLKANKHPEIFVKLAERFSSDSDLTFFMIGRSSAKWKNLTDKFNLIPHCEYLGLLSFEEVNEFLKNTDIVVSTGSKEGFPNIMIQSWMLGIPVLSYGFDPDELIKNQQLGMVSSNFDELVTNLKLLASDIALRNELGQNARNYAIRHFSLLNLEKLVKVITSEPITTEK